MSCIQSLCPLSDQRGTTSHAGHVTAWIVLSALCLSVVCGSANADLIEQTEQVQEPGVDLTDMDQMLDLELEQLMRIDVTSVAGVAQPWFQTPAAMYVITSQDIRRSGHMSIPEALRMAPGLHVAQNTSWMWSISSRGFSGTFANKLLVLVDGREIYDPLFPGTFWDIHDMIMDDIDRIEVIRGPGATLWGANAVNGVINITSKSAKDTQGLYVSGGVGDVEQGFGELRYGGTLSDSAWFRVWGSYHDRSGLAIPNAGEAADDWDMSRAGFRIDADMDGGDGDTTLTLLGDAHHSDKIGEQVTIPIPGHLTETTFRSDDRAEGVNFSFDLRHEHDDGRGWQLKGYYTRTERSGLGDFEIDRDTISLDFQHHFTLDESNDLIWGVLGRYIHDDIADSAMLSFDPNRREDYLVSAFIQDTLTLVPDKFFAMFGSKFENNDHTGFEYQPSARLWWTPDEDHTVWVGVSRAVRVPTRADSDLILTSAYVDTGLINGAPATGVYVPLTATGTPGLESEVLYAYEAGYRQRIADSLTVDIAGFYNDYDDLITFPSNGSNGPYQGDGAATTYGVETTIDWRAAPNWRISASHSYIYLEEYVGLFASAVRPPRNQFQVRSQLDLTDDLEFNTALYYYEESDTGGTTPVIIDTFVRLDAGLTWRPKPNLEVAVWGQNLLEPSHIETTTQMPLTSYGEVPRSVYLRVTHRF